MLFSDAKAPETLFVLYVIIQKPSVGNVHDCTEKIVDIEIDLMVRTTIQSYWLNWLYHFFALKLYDIF